MKLAAASTLALAIATTGAFAASHTTTDANAEMDKTENSAMTDTAMTDTAMTQGDLIRTRDITGGNIYTFNAANDEGWNPGTTYDQVGADWNQIGEIEDIVLSKDGKMIGIVGEVGGFLDIGDKHVLIRVEDVSLVAVDDKTYAYVTRLSEEDLEAMESVDEGFWN